MNWLKCYRNEECTLTCVLWGVRLSSSMMSRIDSLMTLTRFHHPVIPSGTNGALLWNRLPKSVRATDSARTG